MNADKNYCGLTLIVKTTVSASWYHSFTMSCLAVLAFSLNDKFSYLIDVNILSQHFLIPSRKYLWREKINVLDWLVEAPLKFIFWKAKSCSVIFLAMSPTFSNLEMSLQFRKRLLIFLWELNVISMEGDAFSQSCVSQNFHFTFLNFINLRIYSR